MALDILVVDDDATNRQMLRMLLGFDGHNVEEARDGIIALKKIKAHKPDVIVLDLMMPRMDGFEVCRRLRRQPETIHLPIIVLSAISTSYSAGREVLEAGANAFLPKPVSYEELQNLLNSVTSSSSKSFFA